jgi:uncharacterized protein YodC (DUF2158 family)
MKEICKFLRRKLGHRKPVFVVIFFLMCITFLFAHESIAGHNNSSLSGTYVMHIFRSGFHGGDVGAWGENDELNVEEIELVFDGAGNVTSSFSEDQLNRELLEQPVESVPDDWVLANTYNTTYSTDSDTDIGTYSVLSDGTVTITFSDGDGTGMLSSDGNTIVFSEAEFEDSEQWGSISFGVGVKQGSGFNNSSLSGTYVMQIFRSGFHGGVGGAWGENDELNVEEIEFVFDGAGNFTSSFTEDQINRELLNILVDLDPGPGTDHGLQNTYNTTHSTDSDTDFGTYSVASDGTFTVTFNDGSGGTAMLNSDGNNFVFSEGVFENSEQRGSMEFGVGVKQGSGFDNSSLSGTYVMHIFHSGFQGVGTGGWGVNDELRSEEIEFIFDGAGNFTSSFTEGQINRELLDQLLLYLPGDYVLENTYDTIYTTDSDTDFGTYSVASDGTVTVTFTGGDGGTAMLSSDGNTFIFSEAEFEDSEYWGSVSFGVGIKQIKDYDELAVDFGSSGLYHYDNGTWAFLTGSNSEDMVAVGRDLYVDFGTSGLYKYDGTWTFLTGSNSEDMVAMGTDLYVDFGTSGLYKYDGTWTWLTGSNSEDMVAVGTDLYVDFGTAGLFKYDGTWTWLTGANSEDMVAVGTDLYVDFGASGLYKYDGTWTFITGANAEDMVAVGTDLYVDFGASGLYKYDGTWTFLTGNSEDMVAVGTDLYVDFGTSGLYKYDGTWTLLTGANAEDMVAVGTDLYVDFGASGLYKYDGTWTFLTGSDAEDMIAVDLND